MLSDVSRLRRIRLAAGRRARLICGPARATFWGAKPITEGEANGATQDLEHRVPPPLGKGEQVVTQIAVEGITGFRAQSALASWGHDGGQACQFNSAKARRVITRRSVIQERKNA